MQVERFKQSMFLFFVGSWGRNAMLGGRTKEVPEAGRCADAGGLESQNSR